MKEELVKINSRIDFISSELSKLPEGNLYVVNDSSHKKWYLKSEGQKKYLPKRNSELASKLAYRKYLLMELDELLYKKKLAMDYVSKFDTNSKSQDLLSLSSPYSELISRYVHTNENYLENWVNSDYEHNNQYPEHLIYDTLAGHKVRSKSEVMISQALFMHRIPYRYECMLEIGGIALFPDFTIMHPKKKSLIYWEHFGLMDDLSYSNKANSKINLYINSGIYPMDTLITTFETVSVPISVSAIEDIIKKFFS